MIRTKGEAGSGNIVEAVRHMRAVMSGIRRLTMLGPEELMTEAKNLGAPYEHRALGRQERHTCRCRTSRRAASPPRPTRRS